MLKGTEVPDEPIYVLEHGGKASGEQVRQFLGGDEKIGKNAKISSRTVIIEDYAFSKPGDEVILFLKNCASDVYEKTAGVDHLYVPAGVVQGKLIKIDGKYVSCTPDSVIDENPNLTAEEKTSQKQKNYSINEIVSTVERVSK